MAASTTPQWKLEHQRASLLLGAFGASANLAAAVPDAAAFLFVNMPAQAVFKLLLSVHEYALGKEEPSTGKVCENVLRGELALAAKLAAVWPDVKRRAAGPADAFQLLLSEAPGVDVSPVYAHAMAYVIAYNGKNVPSRKLLDELNALRTRSADDTTLAKTVRLATSRDANLPLYWEHDDWVVDDVAWAVKKLRAATAAAPVLTYQSLCAAGLSGPRFFNTPSTRFAGYPFGNTGLFLAYARSLELLHDGVLC